MIEAVSLWIKDIILLVLFASFLELLLPSSGMQRFIRVIIGLFIMLAILNPVIDLLQNDWDSRQVPALSTNSTGARSVLNSAGKLAGEKEQLVVATYKKELGRQISATAAALEGVAEARTAVELEHLENTALTGKISRVTIYIQPGVSASHSKIKKVAIGEAQAAQRELTETLKQKIITTVSELYQIPGERIELRLLHQ